MPSAKDVGKALATGAAPQAAGGALRRVLEVAIDGKGKWPSARSAAGRHLEKNGGSVDRAIDSVITSHISLASGQGFLTNLGGLATMPVAVPANLTGLAVLQVRMVASIAHLRGYDINDGRVRTAVVMCLLGGEQIGKLVVRGGLPTTPMAVATAPVFDPELDRRVASTVLGDLLESIGGKRLALMLGRRVPLLGGGIGAVYDGISTRQIGRFARGEFPTRRAIAS